MATKDTIGKWQDRLSNTFRGPGGIVGERLSPILAAETRYGEAAVQDSHGFTTLMDCFQDFYLQTFDEMVDHAQVKNVNVYAVLAASFHSLRYALQGFYRGYPYPAAGNIRAIFENAFFLGAVLNGFVKHDDLFSFASKLNFQSDSFAQISRAQQSHLRALDQEIRERIRGQKSGLSSEKQQDIDEILRMLHGHVHRAESTIVRLYVELVQTKKPLSLSPQFDQRSSSHFPTPMVYACWLLHRVLPYVSYPQDFSADWQHKYGALNESFDFYVRGTQGAGYEAFSHMVEQKFTFEVDSAWANVKVESMQGIEKGG